MLQKALLAALVGLGSAIIQSSSLSGVRINTIGGVPTDRCLDDLFQTASKDCQEDAQLSSKLGVQPEHTIILPSSRGTSAVTALVVPVTGTGLTAFTATGGAPQIYLSPQTGETRTTAGPCGALPTANPNVAANAGSYPLGLDSITTAGATATALSITFAQAAWVDLNRELEESPRALCMWVDDSAGGTTTGRWVWMGVYVATAWDCDTTTAARSCAQMATDPFTGANPQPTTLQLSSLARRTTCCRRPTTGTVGLGVSVCINPNTTSCCGGMPYEAGFAKCCNADTQRLAATGAMCPCENDAECSGSSACCAPKKYSDAINNMRGGRGYCYDGGRTKCCDTGIAYDSATSQCCAVTGVQNLNLPCPCHTDAHCASGEIGTDTARTRVVDSFKRCCRQTQNEHTDYLYADRQKSTPLCSVYNNYPDNANVAPNVVFGEGNPVSTHCSGVCVDTRFQICCNGVTCVREYEQCCNATCCNKWTGTCAFAFREGTEGNAANWADYGTRYYQCTTQEHLSPLRAILVFVLPVFFLLLAFAGLAVAFVFATKSTARAFDYFERAMMVLSSIAILFAAATFFSPIFKYGLFATLALLVTFVTAAVESRVLNAFDVGVLAVLLLYLLDPFHGNLLFTTASDRTTNGVAEVESSGVLHAATRLYRNQFSLRNDVDRCSDFYSGYFRVDHNLQDTTRLQNPEEHTFGYCSRGWVVALLIFQAILIGLVMILFLLSLYNLLYRVGAKQ